MMLFPMAYQKHTADVAAKKPTASTVLGKNTKQAGIMVFACHFSKLYNRGLHGKTPLW